METEAILEARRIEKSYPCPTETVRPIRGLDLSVRRGDFILIFGPSGSGKSTLLNLLGGIDRVDSGDIYFEGERYDQKSDREITLLRRHRLGLIFQSFELVPVMTCRDNIEYPLILQGVPAKERVPRVESMAELLGIGGLLNRKPELISGGQKQRVAICRALVAEYSVILGDEITGNLDPATSERVYDILRSLNHEKGKTFVMVTHNGDLKKYANRVFHMVDGKLEEER